MTKAEFNDAISLLLGIQPPPMSTGSTESKMLFVRMNEVLGLGLDSRMSKQRLARAICEVAGEAWSPMCESRGGTITTEGLSTVYNALLRITS